MSIKISAMAIIVLFIILLASFPQATAATQKPRTITIYLPAVEQTSNGEKGVIVAANVTVIPGGSGKIEVTAPGHVDPTTKYSIEQAAAIASILAGVDWRSYDFKLAFINATDVAGPSGSAYTALAFYALITGSPIIGEFKNMTMTGAITPVGLYGPIGGAVYKCHAAERSRLEFYYPLANLNMQLETECPQGRPIAGLLGAVSTILGVNYTSIPIMISMPPEFLHGMSNAAVNMSKKASQVLASLPRDQLSGDLLDLYNQSLQDIRESYNLTNVHPYAAASYAFTALLKAYEVYYEYNAMKYNNKTGLRNFLDKEASSMEVSLTNILENMSKMPSNGSIYYIEFLGTAYSRTASALSTIESIDTIASYDWYQAVMMLGYVKARIYSIQTWLQVARAVEDLKPTLSSSEVESLAILLGDYTHIASQYSISLAQYMIENYGDLVNKNLLENYIQILQSLVESGDNYITKNNYVAALGFYREALSKSMSNLFELLPVENKTIRNKIFTGYMNESITTYDTIALQLVSKGVTPGLAPAYMEYAMIIYNSGDKTDGLNIAMEALASSIEWYLYSLQGRAASSSVQSNIKGGGQEGTLLPGNGYPMMLWLLVSVLIGILIGLVFAFRQVADIARKLQESY